MLRQSSQNLIEQSYLRVTQTRPTSGRIVARDDTGYHLTIDIGHVDANGNPQYLQWIPFIPSSPPAVGDNVDIKYSDLTPNAPGVAGTAIGGQNATVTVIGVQSLNGATGAVLTAVDGYINQSTAGQTTTFKVPMWKRGDL